MITPKFTQGPWEASVTSCEDDIEIFGEGKNGAWIACMVHAMHSELDHETVSANAALITAAPYLYAYAEFEERKTRLSTLEHEAYETRENWRQYHIAIWKLRDEIIPEIASQCPATTTDKELCEWFGDEWRDHTHADIREHRFGDESSWGDSFVSLLHARLTELRTAALAKARGEDVR